MCNQRMGKYMSLVLSRLKSRWLSVFLLWLLTGVFFLTCGSLSSWAEKHSGKEEIGLGYTRELDAPQADVLDAVDSELEGK